MPVGGLKRGALGALGLPTLALATLGIAAVRQPFGGDDVYVLENLRSGAWSRRLFAFDVDAPSADAFAWWTGEVFQRRFLRVPASALLWLEWELFGRNAVLYHLVTLMLVLSSCWLVHRLARRYLPATPAVAVALVPALHPATSEIVGSLNNQPLATAGLFSVAAAVAWERSHRTGSRAAFVLALLCCALAMTSYEAAIVLPFALALGERALSPHPRRREPRRLLALLAVFVAYLPLVFAIRRGLPSPDSGPLRPLGEILRSARLDATAYGLKAFGLFDPRDPNAYSVHLLAGEPFAIALALLLLVAVFLLVRRNPAGLLGWTVFGLFLLPPWLTRATVSQLNLPTLRQVYLPLLMGAPLVAGAFWSRARSRPTLLRAGAALSLAALASQSILSSALQNQLSRMRTLDSSLRSVMADIPARQTIVGIGDSRCGESPSLVSPNEFLFGIPTTVNGATPTLTALDANTLLARAPDGELDVLTAEEPPTRSPELDRGPVWLVRRPPPLVTRGAQRIPGGATASIAERSEHGVRALLYRFDRPLSQLTFLRLRGCEPPQTTTAGP